MSSHIGWGSKGIASLGGIALINGQLQSGGTNFLVRVRGLELGPYYRGTGDYFTLGKAVDFAFARGGPVHENDCKFNEYNFRCEWKNGAYVYTLSATSDNRPEYPQALFLPIEELLDSFETDTP
jgi:hypothetical protein